jgi:hypothetical protein
VTKKESKLFVLTGVLQIAFILGAGYYAATEHTALTIFFCTLAMCEEISAQHQENRAMLNRRAQQKGEGK